MDTKLLKDNIEDISIAAKIINEGGDLLLCQQKLFMV